jgi:hypothetical protein
MSSYSILKDVTEEIRRSILTALTSAPDADYDINREAQITLASPSANTTGNPLLSVFLYHIEPDAALRNQHLLADAASGLRLPPLALQLRYLITPLDDEEENNHLVLGRILQYFHDNPQIERLNNTTLDNSFGGASPALRIMLESLPVENLLSVWNALEVPYRLSVVYVVRVAAIDSDKGVTPAYRVLEKQIVVGRAAPDRE